MGLFVFEYSKESIMPDADLALQKCDDSMNHVPSLPASPNTGKFRAGLANASRKSVRSGQDC